MNRDRLRRFSPIQIAYHWAQAAPYLVLLATGVLLLVQRSFAVELISSDTLSFVHEVAGIVLIATVGQTVLVALISLRIGELWRILREALTWKVRDLLWLLKAPLNTLWSGFALPASGFLNAGQKLHVLFQSVAVPVFIATGLAMMFVPGALGYWIIHAVLALGAAAFIALHLFLGLINPPTRKSLGGMFTGFVSGDYARHHHAAWEGGGDDGGRGSLVSLPWAVATVVCFLALAAGAIVAYGPDRAVERAAAVWARRGVDAILPDELCAGHMQDPGVERCWQCHLNLDAVPSTGCLACHETIRKVLADRIGYHGTLTAECITCHPDHLGRDADIVGLDPEAFNHALARFSLDGRHRAVSCDECHLLPSNRGTEPRIRYIGLDFKRCLDCHEDPHEAPELEVCEGCHNLDGWKEPHVRFNHDRDTRFLLNGKHAVIECNDCHKDDEGKLLLRFHEVGSHCIDCHTDPHNGSLGVDCVDCHTENEWSGRELFFDHNRDSKFRLLGRHVEVECRECHVPVEGKQLGSAKFKPLGMRCIDCHDDPHGGQFKKTCEQCHSEEGWTGRWVVDAHGAGAEFPLLGKHKDVKCAECHSLPREGAVLAAARFAGVPRTCVGCHPDPHGGQMRWECATCHSEEGWEGPHLLFVHNEHSEFRIDAIHRAVTCAACHPGGDQPLYRPLPHDCEGCHTDIENGMQGVVSWTGGEPDPHFGRTRCVDCHPSDIHAPSAAVYARLCGECHTPHYEGLYHDWNKSLGERASRAAERVAEARRTGDPNAESLAARAEEIRRIGSHNIQFVRRLWEEVLQTGLNGDESGKNSGR